MTERVEYVTTDQLRTGDLVLNYGMRLRLQHPTVWVDQVRGKTVWAYPGKIENLPEVLADDQVPSAWVRDGYWPVQGNDLARWAVVR